MRMEGGGGLPWEEGEWKRGRYTSSLKMVIGGLWAEAMDIREVSRDSGRTAPVGLLGLLDGVSLEV